MKPSLLFLSQCLPYPPHSGVTNRTYHILKGLAASFDISLLAFRRVNHQPTERDVSAACAAIARLGVDVSPPFAIRSEGSRATKIAVHGIAALTGSSYTYFDYGDHAFGETLHRVRQAHPPALVHMDSLDLHRWIPDLHDLPIACTHHSIESDLLRRRAQQEPTVLLRAHLQRQARALDALERRWCPQLSLNVMMSDLDAERLVALAPGSRTVVAPNGVDITRLLPIPGHTPAKGRIAFLGPSYMLPNRDGIEFFLRDVWHLLRAARPDATFHIIGKVADSHRALFESFPGVTCKGFVPDLRAELADAECCVVPLRIGGGTRLKILDAWAMGCPVVSTSIGCEGLRAVDGDNILIRDDAAGLSAALLQVLSDGGLGEQIGMAGRRTAEIAYTWDAIGTALAQEYLTLIGAGGRSNADATTGLTEVSTNQPGTLTGHSTRGHDG